MTDRTMGVLRAAAEAAARAPSTHNTQPWRFQIEGDKLRILADYKRHLSVIDRERRQLLISCGCALLNARVAIRALGRDALVTTMFGNPADPDVVASIELGGPIVSAEADLDLNWAIPIRHTNRRPFLRRPVPPSEVDDLLDTAALHSAWMVRLSPEHKAALAKLVDEADRMQYADPAFRQELGNWLTPFASRRRDGIPFEEKEYGSRMPFAVMRAVRSPGLGDELSEIERELVLGAPIVAVIGTPTDEPIDWLQCGQALESVLLHATYLGLSASFLNQVLEVPASRAAVGALIGHDYPQMVLRLGYATEAVHHPAPRRSLDQVLQVL